MTTTTLSSTVLMKGSSRSLDASAISPRKRWVPVITDLWARDEFPREMSTLIVGKHITGLRKPRRAVEFNRTAAHAKQSMQEETQRHHTNSTGRELWPRASTRLSKWSALVPNPGKKLRLQPSIG